MHPSLTGCKVPCTYQHYSLVDHPFTLHTTYSYFSISYISTDDTLEEEVPPLTLTFYTPPMQVLIYPLDSLISELGGALGLFLGFSFLGFFAAVRDLAEKLFQRTETTNHSVE